MKFEFAGRLFDNSRMYKFIFCRAASFLSLKKDSYRLLILATFAYFPALNF